MQQNTSEEQKPADRKIGPFARFATRFGDAFGSAQNFVVWVILLIVWVAVGHSFHWSNTWQLIANTPTTWLELFAAITIQYVGNRIERRQEQHEAKMMKILEHLEKLSERQTTQISTDKTSLGAQDVAFNENDPKIAPAAPGTVVRPDLDQGL